MRLVILLIAIVFLASLATLYAIENPGYVLIARAPWSIEMSLTLFIPLVLLGFAALYFLLYALIRIWRIPRDVTRWRYRRRTREARTGSNQGLVRLAEGNWVEAEAQLISSMRFSDAPLINYLGAACASQGQDKAEKRDEYLAMAHKSAPNSQLAIGMIQARLQSQARQYEQALATLSDLRTVAPRHKEVLKMLAQVYAELRDWTGLAALLPELRQANAMRPGKIDALELRAHRELLTLSLPSGSTDILRKAWNAVPKSARRDPALIATYARQLIQQGDMGEAEAILRGAIEENWDEALVDLYGLVRSDRPAAQREHAEGWLRAHGENPRLLLTLGRLAMREETGKKAARAYFEKCIASQGPVAAYHELGRLLEQLGEQEQALAVYRRGLDALAMEQQAKPTRVRYDVGPPRQQVAR